jgi:hypothetical protein
VGAAALISAVLGWSALVPSALANQSSRLPYLGGPVLHSSRPYLVFWTPPGESIPSGSESLIERYFTDVAAHTDKSSNVFGVLRQYYDGSGFADYRQAFDPGRQVVVDTQPYPPRDPAGCPDVSASYPTCISDEQIQSEVQRLIRADGLPTAGKPHPELVANAPIYFVVLPADVNVCTFAAGQCADKNLTGYHDPLFDNHGRAVLYAAITMDPLQGVSLPPPISGACDPGGTGVAQEPNGDPGDCAINWLSHEDSETITDPLNSGWRIADRMLETGDACQHVDTNPDALSPTLGGSASGGTLYTQVINGDRYYTQTEWSNGDGKCEMQPTAGRIGPRFRVRGRTRAGIPVSFDPGASTSMNTLSSATWNLGDGSNPAFSSGHAALTHVTHRFRRAGRYTITLTLVDNRGNLQRTSRRLTIQTR